MSTRSFALCAVYAGCLLAGCGGGGGGNDAATASSCSLTNPGGCGGMVQPTPPVAQTPAPTPVPPVIVAPAPAPQVTALSLVVSNTELGSAGLAGGDVLITALVKGSGNTALAGVKVDLSADSGILTVQDPISDKNGKVSATLGTGGANANRAIKVSASAGAQSASASVNVVGTTLALSGAGAALQGNTVDVTATLRDSAGHPIPGVALALASAHGSPVTPGAPVTDAQGQARMQLRASQAGAEMLSASALGASARMAITIGSLNPTELSVKPAPTTDASGNEVLAQNDIGSCVPVDIGYTPQGGQPVVSLLLSSSRGRLYADPACGQLLASTIALNAGAVLRAYLSSPDTGVATLDASVAGGPSASTRIRFVAPLTQASQITLQSDLPTVGSGERSTLIATVRDNTAANNLVSGATIAFSIGADASGGALDAPFTVSTGSDGRARAVFVAGPGSSGKDGVAINARIVQLPAASATTYLTVNKRALSIQFGTGNTVLPLSPTLLQQEFSVLVSDSAGVAVPGVSISATVWPTSFAKGEYQWYPLIGKDGAFDPAVGSWAIDRSAPYFVCANEDLGRNGVYDAGLDTNGNGVLDPGIPTTVSSAGKTDALGLTTLTLTYPRDRAQWVEVELSVRGAVAGTESIARTRHWLRGLVSDYSAWNVAPPGQPSPYGTLACSNAN